MSNATPLDTFLAEVEKRAKAATPGPLIIQRYDNDGGDIHYQIETEDVTRKDMIFASVWNHKANADFVVYSRTDLPTLLSMVKELKAGLEDAIEHGHELDCSSREDLNCDCRLAELTQALAKCSELAGGGNG